MDVSIQGFVASVTSDLTYINKEKEAVGALFIFPLDEQSAVYHFEAEIDGKVIIAECQDKEQVQLLWCIYLLGDLTYKYIQ